MKSRNVSQFINITASSVVMRVVFALCAVCCLYQTKAYTQDETVKVAPVRNYDRETVKFSDKTAKKTTNNSKTGIKGKTTALTNGIVPMVIMGVIVLGIFLWICLTIFKKLFPGGKQLFSSPGMEILGRTHFDSQKYLSLVRVGSRIIVVGVSQHGFDQISEISDAEEVTEILSATKPKTSNGQNLFYKMFQKQVQKNSNPTTTIDAAEPIGSDTVTDEAEETLQQDSNSGSKLNSLQERIKKQKFFE